MAAPDARELIGRLPATFRPALNDQLRNWDLLFPAEQRLLTAQLDWLGRLPAADFEHLFALIAEFERQMDLPRWSATAAGINVQDTGRLARSPFYPRWREEVEKVFRRIGEAVETSGRLRRVRRLLLCVLPGTEIDTQVADKGTWVPLASRFDALDLSFAKALAARSRPPGVEEIESTWIFECEPRLSAVLDPAHTTVLCWDALEPARREFLSRLNLIHRDLGSVDQTNEQLKKLDLTRLLGRTASTPQVREFVRSLFLSGNGSLVFNNSFVEWGASEALRRVEPQVLVARFGIRPKLKPFSSTVLFEDQTRANPVQDESDPAGSLVDAIILAKYVYLSAQRYSDHQERPLTLMTAAGADRLLVLGPNVPTPGDARLSIDELTGFALRWLAG